MRELWKAFLARLVYLLTPHPIEALRPGQCECGHKRCCHRDGTGPCGVMPKQGWRCACDIFIPKKRNDGDNPPTPEPTPKDVIELERMFGK